ncbi:class I SAM-dependent methyltransferase [Nonomuraea sp. NPDC050643]|uniref:class I SAM-dependent methyltransferase n=1 Tax=Nonomuraea sp. NPDC050643 TaxID=3155660 RepID=UPI0033DFC70E
MLEIACGHGRISRALAGRGADVVGADLSAALIAKARAAEPRTIRYAQLVAGRRRAVVTAPPGRGRPPHALDLPQHLPPPRPLAGGGGRARTGSRMGGAAAGRRPVPRVPGHAVRPVVMSSYSTWPRGWPSP